jgi:hypothetical protein
MVTGKGRRRAQEGPTERREPGGMSSVQYNTNVYTYVLYVKHHIRYVPYVLYCTLCGRSISDGTVGETRGAAGVHWITPSSQQKQKSLGCQQ